MSTSQPVSLRAYVLNFAGLIALATGSLLLSGLPDSVAVTLSLVIAFIKAALVLLFFMHLIEERFSFRFVMLVSTLLVGILIALTALDPATRAPYAPAPSENRSYQPKPTTTLLRARPLSMYAVAHSAAILPHAMRVAPSCTTIT